MNIDQVNSQSDAEPSVMKKTKTNKTAQQQQMNCKTVFTWGNVSLCLLCHLSSDRKPSLVMELVFVNS